MEKNRSAIKIGIYTESDNWYKYRKAYDLYGIALQVAWMFMLIGEIALV